jgi:hypothetical protein
VLRVCLGAPEITSVGERMRAGKEFDAAFAPLAADLADLFGKWTYVRDRLDLAQAGSASLLQPPR